jgi:hypothetical protein
MWCRLDDSLHDNPKIVRLTSEDPRAVVLWLFGLSWCGRHLTDGFLPEGLLPRIVPWPVDDLARLAGLLVQVDLWEPVVGGFQYHNFLEWNPSKAQVNATRARYRRHKAAQRAQTSRPQETSTVDVPQGCLPQKSTGDISRLHTPRHASPDIKKRAAALQPRTNSGKPLPIDPLTGQLPEDYILDRRDLEAP